MTKTKILKITDIVGDTIIINLEDISYIRTDTDKLKVKFKGTDGEYHFDHIPKEEMEKVIAL